MVIDPNPGWSAECPKCKEDINGYCPIHGVPGGQYNDKGIKKEYFRPEFKTFQDYQLCSKCHARNPYGANFCKYCGENITSQAEDKNGHGWVDLGLSVLWSTYHCGYNSRWDGYSHHMDETEWMHMFDEDIDTWVSKNIETNRIDPATIEWGEKWRTPTKEEFEELIINCKWEKCLHPNSNRYALKGTGPNGNSIYMFVTGAEYCGEENHDIRCFEFPPDAYYTHCLYWTSSETERATHGWAFHFRGYEGFVRRYGYWRSNMIMSKDEQKKIEERDRLWLNTPVEILCNGKTICKDTGKTTLINNTIIKVIKCQGLCIRPVADKKWQGKL